ncbi:MAG: DUF1508 domain-containing protein, partial [Chloroflexi bacterium]|nr:DUF1508 domain-containing protein [Chloroflexota bacterium]
MASGHGPSTPPAHQQEVGTPPPSETRGSVSEDVPLAQPSRRLSSATFEIYTDRAGEFRWRPRHDNGQIIAEPGEGYSRKENAINGLNSVKENAPAAAVADQTGEGHPVTAELKDS